METKFTAQDLKAAQALPLQVKVGRTIAKIMEFYKHFEGKVYISFSGGKDSTVLLYLARQIYPDIPAVFVNTGLEYPEIVRFVQTFDNVTMLRPKMSFKKVLETYGYPVVSKEVAEIIRGKKEGMPSIVKCFEQCKSTANNGELPFKYQLLRKWMHLENAPFRISGRCCHVMKKAPAHKYERETGRHPLIGTLAEESLLRRENWLRYGCNAFDGTRPRSTPMAFWTEQDVLEYIRQKNISIAPIYGDIVEGSNGRLHTTGAHRTGCMFCLFGIHLEKEPNKIQRLYYTHPKIYNYILEKLGFREVMEYMHIPYEPVPDMFLEQTIQFN